jgi:hypothetical protein
VSRQAPAPPDTQPDRRHPPAPQDLEGWAEPVAADRLLLFSDAVFAISATLLVLDIGVLSGLDPAQFGRALTTRPLRFGVVIPISLLAPWLALIEGFFGFVWFGWEQANASPGLRVPLAVGGGLAVLVAVVGGVLAFRSPAADSALHDRLALRRYGLVVGLEFALAGAAPSPHRLG